MKRVKATFGAGCFWCIEACFKDLAGAISVEPGYCGGQVKNPSYQDVISGSSGHAEVAQIVFDEDVLSYDNLLEMFFFLHDPTQLNRQGNDVGTQYRSVVFYHNEEQKDKAESCIERLTEMQVWDNEIVTELSRIGTYYSAEDYHKNYLELHPTNPYCEMVVRPKVDKFKKVFETSLSARVF
jgi:peptide-methionine (S)-S-oxide reductase